MQRQQQVDTDGGEWVGETHPKANEASGRKYYDAIRLFGNQVFCKYDHVHVLDTKLPVQIVSLYEESNGAKKVAFAKFHAKNIATTAKLLAVNTPNFVWQDGELLLDTASRIYVTGTEKILPGAIRVEYRFPSGRQFVTALSSDAGISDAQNARASYFVERQLDEPSNVVRYLDEAAFNASCFRHFELCQREPRASLTGFCPFPQCAKFKILSEIEHAAICKLPTCAFKNCSANKALFRSVAQCACQRATCQYCGAFARMLAFHESCCTRSCTFPRCKNSSITQLLQQQQQRQARQRVSNSAWSILLNKSYAQRRLGRNEPRIGSEYQVSELPSAGVKTRRALDISEEEQVVWRPSSSINGLAVASLFEAARLAQVRNTSKQLLPRAGYVPVRTAKGMVVWAELVRELAPMAGDGEERFFAIRPYGSAADVEVRVSIHAILLSEAKQEEILLHEYMRRRTDAVIAPALLREDVGAILQHWSLPQIDLLQTAMLHLCQIKHQGEGEEATANEIRFRLRTYERILANCARACNKPISALLVAMDMLPMGLGLAHFVQQCSRCKLDITAAADPQMLRPCARFTTCATALCPACFASERIGFEQCNADFQDRWFCQACRATTLPAAASDATATRSVPASPLRQQLHGVGLGDIIKMYDKREITAEEGMAQVKAMTITGAKKTMRLLELK